MIYARQVSGIECRTILNITNSKLSYQMTVEGNEHVGEVLFSDVQKCAGFADNALIGFPADRPNLLQNLQAKTLVGRTQLANVSELEQVYYMLLIHVPAASVAGFDECSIVAMCDHEANLSANVSHTMIPAGETVADKFYSRISMSGPATVAPDGFAEVALAVKKPDGTPLNKAVEIYLEPVYGLLPKTRIKTDATGVAKFKVYATGLEVGDSVRVKAGFKYFTGVGDYAAKVG